MIDCRLLSFVINVVYKGCKPKFDLDNVKEGLLLERVLASTLATFSVF